VENHGDHGEDARSRRPALAVLDPGSDPVDRFGIASHRLVTSPFTSLQAAKQPDPYAADVLSDRRKGRVEQRPRFSAQIGYFKPEATDRTSPIRVLNPQ
jgi:hypothetical protein